MKTILPLILFTVLFSFGCTRQAPSQLGSLTDRHYENEHFGLALDLPADWHVQPGDFNEMLMEMGEDAFGGDDRVQRAQIKQAMKHTFVLFTVTEHEVGTPGVLNPMVIAMVERLTHAPGIKSADDYATVLKGTFGQMDAEITIGDQLESEQFGGKEFSTLKIAMTANGVAVSQKYRMLFKEGYVFALICTYFDEASEARVDGLVNALQAI
jgi:hypothetical protein